MQGHLSVADSGYQPGINFVIFKAKLFVYFYQYIWLILVLVGWNVKLVDKDGVFKMRGAYIYYMYGQGARLLLECSLSKLSLSY